MNQYSSKTRNKTGGSSTTSPTPAAQHHQHQFQQQQYMMDSQSGRKMHNIATSGHQSPPANTSSSSAGAQQIQQQQTMTTSQMMMMQQKSPKQKSKVTLAANNAASASGMQNFEEGIKRNERTHLPPTQAHLMHLRGNNASRSPTTTSSSQQQQMQFNKQQHHVQKGGANLLPGMQQPQQPRFDDPDHGTSPGFRSHNLGSEESPPAISATATAHHNFKGSKSNNVPASGGMTAEYYAQVTRQKMHMATSPKNSAGLSVSNSTGVMPLRSTGKTATPKNNANNFMNRRMSEEKFLSSSQAKSIRTSGVPQLQTSGVGVGRSGTGTTTSGGLHYQDYLEMKQARSPKLYPSKQLEALQQAQNTAAASGGNTNVMMGGGMFMARNSPKTTQMRIQTSQGKYGTQANHQHHNNNPMYQSSNSTSAAVLPSAAKSRNPHQQMQMSTSHGSASGFHQSSSTNNQHYRLQQSPKGGTGMTTGVNAPNPLGSLRDSKNSKLRFSATKQSSSPKQGGVVQSTTAINNGMVSPLGKSRLSASNQHQQLIFQQQEQQSQQQMMMSTKRDTLSSQVSSIGGKMRSSGSPTTSNSHSTTGHNKSHHYIHGQQLQQASQQQFQTTSTGQYKKVLEKGDLCGGKVLDDHDENEDSDLEDDEDEDEDYEDEDFDEKAPQVQMVHSQQSNKVAMSSTSGGGGGHSQRKLDMAYQQKKAAAAGGGGNAAMRSSGQNSPKHSNSGDGVRQSAQHLSAAHQFQQPQHQQMQSTSAATAVSKSGSSPKQYSTKELQLKQKLRMQKELLRNIWVFTERCQYMACYELLQSQDARIARALLNECNSDGWTPLHVASNEGHVEMIQIFHKFSANLNARAKNQRTPLHIACIRGNVGVMSALLQCGADKDAQDMDWNAPIHFCAMYGHARCLEALLRQHPQLNIKNKFNKYPMDESVNKEIIVIFQDYIGRVKKMLASQQSSFNNSEANSRDSGSKQKQLLDHNENSGTASQTANLSSHQNTTTNQQLQTGQENAILRPKTSQSGSNTSTTHQTKQIFQSQSHQSSSSQMQQASARLQQQQVHQAASPKNSTNLLHTQQNKNHLNQQPNLQQNQQAVTEQRRQERQVSPLGLSGSAAAAVSSHQQARRQSPEVKSKNEVGAGGVGVKQQSSAQKKSQERAQISRKSGSKPTTSSSNKPNFEMSESQKQQLELKMRQSPQYKQVQIHDSLNKEQKIAGKHKKTRSFDEIDRENITGSMSSTEPQEDGQRRVGPDDFMPLDRLGKGSFGEVYLVREIRTGELFAMKVLNKSKIFGHNLVRYAKTERDVLSYTKHPFIVGLNYAFQTQTKLFLILEFCPGGDLGRILQKEGHLTEERARMYAAEVLLALENLHARDIIFRDLKPDNVVLDSDGHALLTDFGLSKEGVIEGNKGARSFCGSVAYLAPEMIRKAGHGKSVDWYLLGVLLYEMIVGTPPYFSDSKAELFHNIQKGVLRLPINMSADAKNLIVHLLNRNPSKRLGAGEQGANEIKQHPFFSQVDWEQVNERLQKVPRPRHTYQQFKKAYENKNLPEAERNAIFEEVQEGNPRNEKVEGWSFVNVDDQNDARQAPYRQDDSQKQTSPFVKKRGNQSQTVVETAKSPRSQQNAAKTATQTTSDQQQQQAQQITKTK